MCGRKYDPNKRGSDTRYLPYYFRFLLVTKFNVVPPVAVFIFGRDPNRPGSTMEYVDSRIDQESPQFCMAAIANFVSRIERLN